VFHPGAAAEPAVATAAKATAGNLEKAREDPGAKSAFDTELSRKLRILLVDDNDDNRSLAMRVLAKRGHEVAVARNGQEALDYLATHRVDVALMDLHMPVMDGVQAALAIRERERERGNGERLPIIAMTANALKSQKDECLSSGMDDYLVKPFGFRELFEVVERFGAR
jgi:hypothetical protein